jgi:hypothetical protein
VELDPPVAGFRMTQLRAVARPTRPDLKSLTPSAMVLNDDGTFSLPGLLGPTTVGLQSLPTGWRMRQVLVGERDLAGQDLQVGPGETIGNVRIVLTNRLGELTGTVTTARGEPVADYTVLVFPADPTGLDGSGSGWPDASGAFRVEHLLPGTYYVVALAAFDPARALEPGFRERLWSSATRVTVSPDSPTRVALKLTALP